MGSWTRADLVLTGFAVLLTLALISHRVYQHFYYENAADQVVENIQSVADAVREFHDNTGEWFPKRGDRENYFRVYLDPFHESIPDYQGLQSEWLQREKNFGLVLQLVKFREKRDSQMTGYLFDQPFERHEPYMRVLLDQGLESIEEMEILVRVEKRLPPGAMAVMDDNYFVIDLRRLIHGE